MGGWLFPAHCRRSLSLKKRCEAVRSLVKKRRPVCVGCIP